jgi:hypothetical protein
MILAHVDHVLTTLIAGMTGHLNIALIRLLAKELCAGRLAIVLRSTSGEQGRENQRQGRDERLRGG